MNTINTTANTTTSPDFWGDLWKSDRPLDFEAFLNSDLLATRRNQIKTYGIIRRTSGSISTIASTCLVVHILRSHHGLSTTYHRLVFGLCIGDTISSFASVLGSTMVPKEMHYFIPSAHGNTATCTAQGFLLVFGVTVAAMYNCSICLYYLSIIRYNKKDEYIRNKLEPWFHGISIIIPFVVGFIFMAMKAYNGINVSVCFIVPNYPPHCIGYESGDTPKGFSIPCGRGDGGENPLLYLVTSIVAFGSVLIITPTVTFGTMLLMYRSVSKIEQRMQRYGRTSLRLSAQSVVRNRGENTETNSTRRSANDQGIMSRIKGSVLMGMIPRCCLHSRNDKPPTSRSNSRATSQKRAILRMAAGYAFAWAFVFIPFMIFFWLHETYATLILAACLTPLQGLFNFLVFMSPKVTNAMRPIRGRKNLTWRQGFIKAYMSRGERRRTRGNLRSRNNRSAGSRISEWNQRVQRFMKSILLRTSTRDTSRSNESNNAPHITTNHPQSSNPEQDSAPAEKLPLSNPHLADHDMIEAEGNNTMRPQQEQEDFLPADGDGGDDEEK